MNVEDRLRGALVAEAGVGAEPTTELWDVVGERARSVRRRRRTQWTAAIGLSAAAIAALVFVIVARAPEEKDAAPISEGTGGRPPYIVAIEGERVVVRSSADGEFLRALANGGDAFDAQHVTVSPDGSQVYFTRLQPIECPGGVEAPEYRSEIVRVPMTGGRFDVIEERGSDPLISPQGTHIAFRTSTANCGGARLVVRNIASDVDDATIGDELSGGVALTPLSWSANGTKLLAEGLPPGAMRRELYVVGGLPETPRVRKVVFPEQDTDALQGPAAWGPAGTVIAPVTRSGSTSIVTFDPATGEIREQLFDVSARPWHLTADVTGGHVLVGPEAEQGYTLARWDEDGGYAELGAFMLRDIAWARGPLPPPEQFVGITDDGKLQIRRTDDGSVVRTVREDIDMSMGPPRISVTPDGGHVYVDRYEIEDCPGDPTRKRQKIARVALASGEIDVVAVGADPAVNPLSGQIAYVTSSTPERCGIHDTLVHTVGGGNPDRRYGANEDDPSWIVKLPHWMSDHRGLWFIVDEGSGTSFRAEDTVEPFGADTPNPTRIRQHLAESREIASPGDVALVAEGVKDHFVGARERPGGSTELVLIGDRGYEELLARVDGQVGVGGVSVAWSLHDTVIPSSADHLLMHIPTSEIDVDLVRFSLGALEPVRIADGVVSSAWLHQVPSAVR